MQEEEVFNTQDTDPPVKNTGGFGAFTAPEETIVSEVQEFAKGQPIQGMPTQGMPTQEAAPVEPPSSGFRGSEPKRELTKEEADVLRKTASQAKSVDESLGLKSKDEMDTEESPLKFGTLSDLDKHLSTADWNKSKAKDDTSVDTPLTHEQVMSQRFPEYSVESQNDMASTGFFTGGSVVNEGLSKAEAEGKLKEIEESEKAKRGDDLVGGTILSKESDAKGRSKYSISDADISYAQRVMNKAALDFKKSSNSLTKESNELEEQWNRRVKFYTEERLQDQPELVGEYNDFVKRAEALKTNLAELKEQESYLRENGKQLDDMAGEHFMMRSNLGNWGGGILNAVLRGVGGAAAGVSSIETQAETFIDEKAGSGLSDDEFKQEILRVAQQDGVELPSNASRMSLDELRNALGGSSRAKATGEAVSSSLIQGLGNLVGAGLGTIASNVYEGEDSEYDKVFNKILDNSRKGIKYYGSYEKALEGRKYQVFSETAKEKINKQGSLEKAREGLVDAFGDKLTTEQWEAMRSESFLGGSVIGVAKSLPLILSGGVITSTSALVAQAIDGVSEEMEGNIDFDGVSESEKLRTSIPMGVAMGVLEKVGISNALASKPMLNKIVKDALSKATKNTTAKQFGDIVKKNVNQYIREGVLTVAKGGAAEFETGGLQEIADIGLKAIYNQVKDKEMFDNPDTLTEYTEQVLKAASQEAIGGKIMTTPKAITIAYQKKKLNEVRAEEFEILEAMSKDPAFLSMYKSKLESQVSLGETSVEDAKTIMSTVGKQVGIMNSNKSFFDSNNTSKEKLEALDLLNKKAELEQEIKKSDSDLSTPQQEELAKVKERLVELSKPASQDARFSAGKDVAAKEDLEVKGEVVYHGSPTPIEGGVLKKGQSGAIFLTPNKEYAKQYSSDVVGEVTTTTISEEKKDNLFDLRNPEHVERLKQGYLKNNEDLEIDYKTEEDALRDYENGLRSMREASEGRDGLNDWSAGSQFMEHMENAGFDGALFAERPAGVLDENIVISYALFAKELPVSSQADAKLSAGEDVAAEADVVAINPEDIQSVLNKQPTQFVNFELPESREITVSPLLDQSSAESFTDEQAKELGFNNVSEMSKPIEYYNGIPMITGVSDILMSGNAKDAKGNDIPVNGGLGFNTKGGYTSSAWAGVGHGVTNTQYENALTTYENNKVLFDEAWESGKIAYGHVPMAIVRMGNDAVHSNEASFRFIAAEIKDQPLANQQEALKVALKAKATPNSIKKFAAKNNITDMGSMMDAIVADADLRARAGSDKAAKAHLSLSDRAKFFDVLVSKSNPDVKGETKNSKNWSKALYKGVENADLTILTTNSLYKGIGSPTMMDLRKGDVVAVMGVDVLDGGLQEVDHPNYGIGLKGKILSFVSNPVNGTDIFTEWNTKADRMMKPSTDGEMPSPSVAQGQTMGTAPVDTAFQGAKVNTQASDLDLVVGALRNAFPTVTVSNTQSEFDAAVEANSEVRDKNTDEVIYGFTKDGAIVLNPRVATTNTAIHEFAHVWVDYLKSRQGGEKGAKLLAKGYALLEGTKTLENAIEKYGDNELAREEALVSLIANKGEALVEESKQNKSGFKRWFKSLFEYVKNAFTNTRQIFGRDIREEARDVRKAEREAIKAQLKKGDITQQEADGLLEIAQQKFDEALAQIEVNFNKSIEEMTLDGFINASLGDLFQAKKVHDNFKPQKAVAAGKARFQSDNKKIKDMANRVKDISKNKEVLSRLTAADMNVVNAAIADPSKLDLVNDADIILSGTKNGIDAFNNGVKGKKIGTMKNVKAAATKVVSNLIQSKQGRIGTAETAFSRRSGFYIDQVLGNYKTRPIYDATVEETAVALEKEAADYKTIEQETDKVIDAIAQSHGNDVNAVQKSKYKISIFNMAVQAESNPDADVVRDTYKTFTNTAKAMKVKDNTEFSAADAKMIEDVLTEFSKDGVIDTKALKKSFNKEELAGIRFITTTENSKLGAKARYIAEVHRGKPLGKTSNYNHIQHLNTKDESRKAQEEGRKIESQEEQFASKMKDPKAKNQNDRVATDTPVNPNAFDVMLHGAKQTLSEYYLSSPIRKAVRAKNQMVSESRNNGTEKEQDVVLGVEGVVDNNIEEIVSKSFNQSSLLDQAASFFKKNAYRAMLASAGRVAVELTTNIYNALLINPAGFVNGLSNPKFLSNSAKLAKFLQNVPTVQTSRLVGEGLVTNKVDASSVENLSRKSTKARGKLASTASKVASSGLGKLVSKTGKVGGKVADAMISSPDQIVMRALWMGVLNTEFKKITGQDIDIDKVSGGNNSYLNKYQGAIAEATKTADKQSILSGGSSNKMLEINKNKAQQRDTNVAKVVKAFNGFMSTFLLMEYYAAQTGIMSAVGKGEYSKAQGARILAATAGRMYGYTMLMPMAKSAVTGVLSNLLFGADEEDEELEKAAQKSLGKRSAQSFASTLTALTVGSDMGGVAKLFYNYKLEGLNQAYGQSIRDGEYDSFEDAISFSLVPRETEGKGYTSDEKKILNQSIKLTHAYSPMLKTGLFATKLFNKDPKKKEGQERKEKEMYRRLPLEVASMLSAIPFVSDIKAAVNKDIYKEFRIARNQEKAYIKSLEDEYIQESDELEEDNYEVEGEEEYEVIGEEEEYDEYEEDYEVEGEEEYDEYEEEEEYDEE